FAIASSDHLLMLLVLTEDLKKFIFNLRLHTESRRQPICQSKLEDKDSMDIAKLMTDHYGSKEALQVSIQTLKEINQLKLACQLEKNTSKKESTNSPIHDYVVAEACS
uniref:Pyrin domain-containing protein n=1 Tax=Pundamilia nyererei TaxID=303518 RepID=A0A3B4GPZ7_9CICH